LGFVGDIGGRVGREVLGCKVGGMMVGRNGEKGFVLKEDFLGLIGFLMRVVGLCGQVGGIGRRILVDLGFCVIRRENILE